MIQYRRGATETVECYTDCVATSASLAITSRTGEAIIASTAATVDTASQTIVTTADHADWVTVSSVAAFVVGRKYNIRSLDGQDLVAELVRISALKLYFATEIPFDATGGTVYATRVYASVTFPDATYLSASAEWTVDAAYEYRTIDVVRYPFTLAIDSARVAESESLYVDTSSRATLSQIARAVEDVAFEILASGRRPELCIDRTMLVQAAVWRACELRNLRQEPMRAMFRGLYKDAMALWERSASWYDSDDSGHTDATSTASDEVPPIEYMRVG